MGRLGHIQANMTYQRTTAQFMADKAKGQKAESTFMSLISLMGGTAYAIGTVPGKADATPRFSRPAPDKENGFCFSVAPDILFSLPDRPRGFSALAQIKVKKLMRGNSKTCPHILLDEKELHRMKGAHSFHDVFFVIHLPEFSDVPDVPDWAYVTVEELIHTELIKRTIRDKPAFLIPFSLFRPLSEISKGTPYEAANTNTAPTS